MRLIVSVDALGPSLTGIGRYTWELVSRLQNTPGLKQLRFYRAGRWVKEPARLLEPSAVLGTEHPMRARSHGPGPTRAKASSSPAWRWATRLYWDTTCRGNVFHAPNYFLPACARNGVVTVHDLSVLKFPETHPAERVRQWETSFADSLGRARQLITDSEWTRQEVVAAFSWPADRVTAVPLGVSADYRPRTPDELRPTLSAHGLEPGGYTLCVSTLEPRKRIESLLGAYRLMPPSVRRRYPLVLVGGSGWRAENLLQRIAEAAAEGWVLPLGFVPAADLPQLYAGARLFAYPSIYEGFGLPVAEAMASGVPVVTSRSSCLPEVAGGAAMLVEPDDSDAFSATLQAGLNDEAWRSIAIDAGLRRAAMFTWSACCAKTVEVYRAALT
jgi:alpha-1,3-rhamnosyl/mannosyltransferase